MKQIALAATVLFMAACSLAYGQVGYRIGTGPVQPLASPWVIDLGDIDSGDVDLHIFDLSSPGNVNDSIGMLTIRGRIINNGISDWRVRVLIASADTTVPVGFSGFEDSRDPGLVNLGGVQFVGPLSDPTDTSLLRKASLSVTVRGDITGDVTAGMLYRVDALRNGGNTAGGTISGNLRAVRSDGAALGATQPENPTIAYVRAGWQITGDIIAEPELNSAGQPIFNGSQINTYGSIGRVVVGPTLTAPGLRGDIRAEYGVRCDQRRLLHRPDRQRAERA
jgi:hypothetical protein